MSIESEERAFLAKILAEPEDDTVRLVYADWLDENGQGDRAEFIRLQIELSKPLARQFSDSGAVEAARKRQDELLARHSREWRGYPLDLTLRVGDTMGVRDYATQLAPGAGDLYRVNSYWSRGFVEKVRLSSEEFLGGPCERCQETGWVEIDYNIQTNCKACKSGRASGLANAIFAAHPVTKVVLTSVPQGLVLSEVQYTRWHDPNRGCEVWSAKWRVSHPAFERDPQLMGLEYSVDGREYLAARDRTTCERYFREKVTKAREPACALNSWWPKVTFRIEVPRERTADEMIEDYLAGNLALNGGTPNVGTL